MIRNAKVSDLSALVKLISESVHSCIEAEEVDRKNIIVDSVCSSEAHLQGQAKGVQLVFEKDGKVLGMILIKDYWNMASLFVVPAAQRQGVATALIDEALKACRKLSLKKEIRLNSSTFAANFYQSYGFHRNGPARDLPGGCVPFVYYL